MATPIFSSLQSQLDGHFVVSVVSLIILLVGGFVGQNCMVSCLVGWPVGQSVSRPSVGQSVGCLFPRPLIQLLIDRPVGSLLGRLVGCSLGH